MSINVKQITGGKDSSGFLSQAIQVSESTIDKSISSDISIGDQINSLTYTETVLKNEQGFKSGTTYYLQFEVDGLEYNKKTIKVAEVKGTLILTHGSDSKDTSVQALKVFEVNTDNEKIESNKFNFECIFTPFEDFEYLMFKKDTNATLTLNTVGELQEALHSYIKLRSYALYEVINKIEENKQSTHIGVQGAPGQLFTLNGSEIKIGKTGIYEFQSKDCPITMLGIIPSGKGFIIDIKLSDIPKDDQDITQSIESIEEGNE